MRVLGVLLLAVLAFNLIDYGLTLRVLSLGAQEANPLMGFLLHYPPAVAICKLVVVPFLLVIIWLLRHRANPRRLIYYAWALFLPYLALIGWHIIYGW